MAKKKRKSADEELLVKIRKRYKAMVDADQSNRRKALEDIKFVNVPGEQWDALLKSERGERPCYEFNKLRVTSKRVINDMRANRPQGKVRGVEDSDKKTAEVYEGLIRNIWNVSDGDTVIDYEAAYQVDGGMGAWRVSSKYAADNAFDQDLCIEPIPNPFCLYADPSAKDILKRDADDWILTERISRSSYEKRWPDAEVCEFETNEFDDDEDWSDEDTVRVCEYWWKEPVKKTLMLMSDGSTVDAAESTPEQLLQAGLEVVKTREVRSHQIMMCIASGDALLEKPAKQIGSQHPFVMVFGEYMIIDGKIHWWGLPRFAKDAQRSYNASRTAIAETIALAPNFKWWATSEQAKGHTDKWGDAHKKNYPFMLYTADPKAPGAPQSMSGAQVPVALIQESQIASEEIKAVTGIFDASLGAHGNETSGKAINARQQQGEIATFNYMDNHAKGIRRTWEILIDYIPHVYDTARTVRILGVDGAEDYAEINKFVVDPATGEQKAVNDVTRGRYDVTVTVGPGYATKRQEASEAYTQLASSDPGLMLSAGDLVYKSLDLPYAEQIAERRRALLPPPIQQMLSKGKNIPPEAQAALAQAEQTMQQAQEYGQMVQEQAQQAEQGKAEAGKAKQEVQNMLNDLELKKTQFDADVTKKLADLTLREAQQVASQSAQGTENERESFGNEMKQAIAEIQTMAAQWMQQAAQTMVEMQARTQPQVIVANPPKSKQVRVRRVNGELIGDVQEVA